MGRRSKNITNSRGKITRPCSRCKRKRSLKEFTPRVKGGHIAACHSCMSKISRIGYYKNLAKSREKARGYQIKARKSKRDFVDWLRSEPCQDCKRDFPPVCMDFDHRPGTKKIADVAFMVNSSKFSLDDVGAEARKCDIVCACCHRIRTFNRPRLRKLIPHA